MERINLNIPSESRAQLKALAAQRGVAEAELARELVLKGLEDERRAAIVAQTRKALTPEVRQELRRIATLMDRIDVPSNG